MQEVIAEQPAITFLNLTGDITITWDAKNREAILELVRQKMEQGFTFFVLKPRLFGLLGHKQAKAGSIEEVAKAGSVTVRDEDFADVMAKLHDPAVESALSQGVARLARTDAQADLDTTHRARTPEDVVSNRTVAVRRVVGG